MTAGAVRVYTALDPAHKHAELTGGALLDLHGLFWVAPTSLTLDEIRTQVAAELDRLQLRPFPSHLGDVYQPKVAT